MNIKCIWCKSETTPDKELATSIIKYANKEHIFPEALGGIRTLPIGLVCEQCNSRLGQEVDGSLKYCTQVFMELYQKSSVILGKPLGKKKKGGQKIRKEKEIELLKCSEYPLEVSRSRPTPNQVTYSNYDEDSNNKYNEVLSRGIHKCAINALLDFKGFDYVDANYKLLHRYVWLGEKPAKGDWAYAICFAGTGAFVHFEPQYLPLMDEMQCNVLGMMLVFPTAIFLVGLFPNLINSHTLHQFASDLPCLNNFFDGRIPEYRAIYKKSFKFIGVSKEAFSGVMSGLDFEIFVEPKSLPKLSKNEFHVGMTCPFCTNTTSIGLVLSKLHTEEIPLPDIEGSCNCIHCCADIRFGKKDIRLIYS